MIAIAGGLLAALGLLAGALLGAAAVGLAAAGPSLWILFPLLTLVGWFLLVVSDVDPLRGMPTRVVASALLLLALLAAVALVAAGAGLLAVQGTPGTLALCYVLVLGGALGATGTAAYGRKAGPPQQS
ncbi:MAG: hypothetical protein JF586_11745 [Burkholderiales bacterium]|nr:hypothetical protein [Burkholderiales bacterium]